MRLSEQDASFLYGETASGPLQTAAVIVLDGCASFEAVLKHYQKRVHLVPRLRERLVFVPFNLGHPLWVRDPNFDIANHVVHEALPVGSTDDDAMARALELNEGLMSRSLPLWKMFVITGVRDRTYILQQAHHAMVDGASAVQMSTLLLDFDPEHEPPGEAEPWDPPSIPTQSELVADAIRESVSELTKMNPAAMLGGGENARGMTQQGLSMMGKFFTDTVVTAPWNATMIGPKRCLDWKIFDLSTFREIRRAFGGTINDVALAAVSEGTARYLEGHGESVEGRKLRVMCPVNIRTEDEAGELGNRVSAIFPMLPAYSQKTLDRYRSVVVETSRIKEDHEAQAMALMQEVTPSVPALVMAPLLTVGTPFDPTRLGATFPAPIPPSVLPRPPNFGVNFLITNVPGVQVPQYIAGQEVIEQRAIMMIGGNMGLGVVVTSYNQKMITTFTADPRMLPDLDELTSAFEQAFEDLLGAAREHTASLA